MKWKCGNDNTFKPVDVTVTCETIAELQEMQARLEIPLSHVLKYRTVQKFNTKSAMNGIGGLRKAMRDQLGSDSVIDWDK